MTENIQEVIDYLEEHTQYWKSKVVKDLATDSEMLNDLIEMLFDEDITGLHFGEFNKTFYLYDDTEEKINNFLPEIKHVTPAQSAG